MKRIVAAIDQGESSLQVARLAADMAASAGAELILVTVGRAIDDAQPELERYRFEEHIEDSLATLTIAEARHRLRALQVQLGNTPDIQITCEGLIGKAANQIVSYAKQHAVDLIAVGHRSRGRLAGLLIGSVAKDVIDSAPCPVLVVR